MSSDPPDRRPARPALKTLLADQRALVRGDIGPLDAGIRGGFADRREAIMWYQAAVVRTLGFLADAWPPRTLSRDPALLVALIDGEARQNWLPDPPDRGWARDRRREIEEQLLLPACKHAYEYLRKSAGEYLSDEEDIDPEELSYPAEQANVAMRPSFQEKDREQRAALQTLWGGFDDRDELTDWLHALLEPSFGELDATTPADVGLDDVAVAHLLGDDVAPIAARRYRERFAIGIKNGDQYVGLLPAFAAGVQAMDAGELARRERTGVQTLRMGVTS